MTEQLVQSQGAPGEAGVVLVVEDSEHTAVALGRLLLRAGLPTAVFQRANDALNFLKTSPVVAAILDIHLPDMNGMILAQMIRDRVGTTLPIVILSGDSSISTLNSLPHVGATHFFSKPVNGSVLVSDLKNWIERAQPESGAQPRII